MNIRLEHANICVHDINGMIEFLRTAFPEFKIRYDGIGSVSGIQGIADISQIQFPKQYLLRVALSRLWGATPP